MAEERRGFAGYGYETAGGDRVTALRDMIDGGGKGRSGGEFEGGGILSLIANMVASPYGSERERSFGMVPASASPRAPQATVRPQMRSPGVSPQMRPGAPTAEELLAGDPALPPGLVQSLSGGPGLASEMVAGGLPNPDQGRSISEILAAMAPEERQVFLPQILASGIPMETLLRR